jgi:glutamyl-tRNA reductase
MIEGKLKGAKNPSALLVGINQMTNLAARRLRGMNGYSVTFANRTAEKAEALASQFRGRGFGLDRLVGLIGESDVVVSCTSSPDPIVTKEMVAESIAQRGSRKLVIMDMAVPRDVDLDKDWNPLVEVNDLEDIRRFVNDRQHERELEVPQAESIIQRRLDEFDYWYKQTVNEPAFDDRLLESICSEELSPILDRLPAELQDELCRATRGIVDRVVRIAGRNARRSN